MYNKYRKIQFVAYQKVRKQLIDNPSIIVDLEKYFADTIKELVITNLSEIQKDYNEASFLFPFWQNYPPDERGRKPRGDQYPWIEVGEHAVGDKLPRLLQKYFEVRDAGIPTGPDKRFVLSNDKIFKLTKGITKSAWLFLDIKSVGPRDDFEHTVMSHNQISGDGMWEKEELGVKNSIMTASGKHTSHKFHCSIPPIYILSDGSIAPVILIALKPVYKMLSLETKNNDGGQPLNRITIVTIPNGLLLEENPAYLKTYPGLFFPGKDNKGKNPLKVRSRVSFDLLKKIANWRVQDILVK